MIAGENESCTGQGGEAFSNILSYQRTFEQGAYIGLLSTNRVYKDGGNGHTLGVNGILRFSELYSLNFEINGNLIKEPQQDWISSSNSIEGKTVALDGEEKKGNAIFVALSRNTRNWNTDFYYQHFSPHYETPLGFVT